MNALRSRVGAGSGTARCAPPRAAAAPSGADTSTQLPLLLTLSAQSSRTQNRRSPHPDRKRRESEVLAGKPARRRPTLTPAPLPVGEGSKSEATPLKAPEDAVARGYRAAAHGCADVLASKPARRRPTLTPCPSPGGRGEKRAKPWPQSAGRRGSAGVSRKRHMDVLTSLLASQLVGARPSPPAPLPVGEGSKSEAMSPKLRKTR